jgi:nicotinamidase-related amidase
MNNVCHSLINVDDCVLIIIDIQDRFLKKLPLERAESLLDHVGWLIDVGNFLHIPMVITAEDASPHNGLTKRLLDKLSPGTPMFNKMSFCLAAQADIMEAINKTNRRTAVLVGLETDVCVAQSSVGLLHYGYSVVAISDATDSPGEAHKIGLDRMRDAGVLVTSLKVVYYEWIRTVANGDSIEQNLISKIGSPKGIIL